MKAVKTRRIFRSNWDELEYVCSKASNLWYKQGNANAAKKYRMRLNRLIGALANHDEAILLADARALLFELNGDISEAIKARQREIALMARLHKSNPPPYALTGRGLDVLANRKRVLASLEKRTEVKVSGNSR